jgi:transcriptional regulator with XRE-family HTH domain
VSYHDELDDVNAEILVELYRRHVKSKERALALSEPRKLLSFLQNTTVKNDAPDLPLSSYLRRVRLQSGIPLEDFAVALDLSVTLLEELEINYSLPWTVTPTLIADVACLFRLHLTMLEGLAQNSLDIAYFSGNLKDRETAKQSMATWLGEVRLELERRQLKDLLS